MRIDLVPVRKWYSCWLHLEHTEEILRSMVEQILTSGAEVDIDPAIHDIVTKGS